MRIVLPVLVTVLFIWCSNARADRIDRLVRILQTEPSYKVRLQVIITLGKLKDRRAVPALIRTLSDPKFTVRGIAAAALGQIGDHRALPALKHTAKKDSNGFVRSQAEKAIKHLGGGRQGPSPGSRFYITVGKLTNKSRRGGSALAQVFGRALLMEFSGVPGVTTGWSIKKPSLRELRKHRLKGYILDGTILRASRTRRGENYELSCSIRVSLATYPGNSMKAFYTGGASMEVSVSGHKPQYENNLFKEIIEGAAQGARQHIVRSYLSSQ